MSFEERVFEWFKDHHRDGSLATEVVEVRASGYDNWGDTEHGFGEKFEVEVLYRMRDGKTRWADVGGEKLASLWAHVVAIGP